MQLRSYIINCSRRKLCAKNDTVFSLAIFRYDASIIKPTLLV